MKSHMWNGKERRRPTADTLQPIATMIRQNDTPASRGERLMRITDELIHRLANDAISINRDACRRVIFHLLADELYGNLPIDIPPFVGI